MCEYGFHCPDPDTCDKTTPPEPTSERYYAWWGGRVIELVPGSAEYQDCPACDDEWQGGSLDTVAVHLNDDHKWKREQIADWLDALPIDLRVVAPSGEKQSITLADLIREGCEDTRQCFGRYGNVEETCALGAALHAANKRGWLEP